MKLKISCLILFTLLVYTFSINATIRFVSKTGSSTPPYTSWETASDSIQKCIDISEFGDTIYVANGVYKERIDMIPGLSLIGSGMDSCAIDTRELFYYNGFYTLQISDSCLVSGFLIYSYSDNLGTAIYAYEGLNITITAKILNNSIQQARTGIALSSFQVSTSENLIMKNKILNVNSGIFCDMSKPLIKDNIIFANDNGFTAHIYSRPQIIGNTIVINNENALAGYMEYDNWYSILKNNSFISLNNGSYGVRSFGDSIVNNLVIGSWFHGILTSSNGSTPGIVINNQVSNATIGIYTADQPLKIEYNNLWKNQSNSILDSTNIYNDPMFVNADSMDFHLQKYSPLIDAGDPNILDKDGSRSDIGLFGGPYGESYTYLDLAPRAPINLTALVDTNYIRLSWNRNTESDTSYYKVYRDTVINFIIDSTKLVSSSPDTFYIQINPHNVTKYVYKVTCIDKQGNESDPSDEIVVNITSVLTDDYPMTISDYRLYQNYPNPFNPGTTISYRLKERGYVKLYVYDIKGELVSVLVNKVQEAGFYQVEFNANSQISNVKGNLASGIYIYQIHVIGENNLPEGKAGIPVFTEFNKMILMK